MVDNDIIQETEFIINNYSVLIINNSVDYMTISGYGNFYLIIVQGRRTARD